MFPVFVRPRKRPSTFEAKKQKRGGGVTGGLVGTHGLHDGGDGGAGRGVRRRRRRGGEAIPQEAHRGARAKALDCRDDGDG